jgi:hypothetical protein
MAEKNIPLPPKIPQSSKDLRRAICLLGSRTKVELSSKSQRELVALIGRYPNQEESATWKQSLKQLIKLEQEACSE